MSRPREPVETVSTSIDLSFLPSRMIEPLPKLRSIWESAASRAFDLSMEEPSTRRNAVVVIAPTPYRTGFAGPTTNGQREEQCTRFVLSSQYVLFSIGGSVSPLSGGDRLGWRIGHSRGYRTCAPGPPPPGSPPATSLPKTVQVRFAFTPPAVESQEMSLLVKQAKLVLQQAANDL